MKHREALLMYICYMEVVFNFVAKVPFNLVPGFFSFDPYILFHFFFKCFFYYYILQLRY